MGKKLTRTEKVKLSKKGTCWKCKGKLEKKDEAVLECKDCGNEIYLK